MMLFLAILAVCLIGIPGLVFVVLSARAAERRKALAYEWSAGELVRRERRIADMEKETAEIRNRIGALMLEKTRLEATVSKLQGIISRSGTGPAAT